MRTVNNMEPVHLTFKEFYLYLIIAQVIIGALLGLIPLILGRKRKQIRLGNYGFLASIVGGAISPLAALIIACVFTWLIARKKETANASPPQLEDRDNSSDPF